MQNSIVCDEGDGAAGGGGSGALAAMATMSSMPLVAATAVATGLLPALAVRYAQQEKRLHTISACGGAGGVLVTAVAAALWQRWR